MPGVTPIGGQGVKAYPDVYSKYKKPTLGKSGSEDMAGGTPTIQSAAQLAAQLAQTGGGATGGTTGGGGPVGGGGTPGGGVGAQVQLSPGVGSAIGKTAAEIAALKAKGPDPLLAESVQNLRNRLSADTT